MKFKNKLHLPVYGLSAGFSKSLKKSSQIDIADSMVEKTLEELKFIELVMWLFVVMESLLVISLRCHMMDTRLFQADMWVFEADKKA